MNARMKNASLSQSSLPFQDYWWNPEANPLALPLWILEQCYLHLGTWQTEQTCRQSHSWVPSLASGLQSLGIILGKKRTNINLFNHLVSSAPGVLFELVFARVNVLFTRWHPGHHSYCHLNHPCNLDLHMARSKIKSAWSLGAERTCLLDSPWQDHPHPQWCNGLHVSCQDDPHCNYKAYSLHSLLAIRI